MSYRVRLTERAEQDIDGVLQWFAKQSAESAGGKWFARLMAMVQKLEKMPLRCQLAAESVTVGLEIREIHSGKRHGTYRLLFEIRGKTVHILRVWHGSRDAVAPDDL